MAFWFWGPFHFFKKGQIGNDYLDNHIKMCNFAADFRISEMSNRPAQTFILVALVTILLLAMHFLPQITVWEHPMRSVNILSDVIPEVYVNDNLEKEDTAVIVPMKTLVAKKDSIAKNISDTVRRHVAVPAGVTIVEDYSDGAPHGMETFYTALDNVKTMDRPVRVAYWGDSYIEGDILVCDLREQLQSKFGGSGVGWVDCGKTTNSMRPTVVQKPSGFDSYAVVQKQHNRALLGPAQRYFKAKGNASLTYSGAKYRKNLDQWDRAALFFRTSNPLTITATFNGQDQTFYAQSMPDIQEVHVDGPMSKVKWNINGANSSTVFYGGTLEPHKGISVDNFSMRGCSGLTLSEIPEQTMIQMSALYPYDLIILQFGLNAVNERSGPKWFDYYQKQMGNIINRFKRAYPKASILVVSIPDRGSRVNGKIVTMKGVEGMVACQQRIAKENKVAFLNFFQMMGGRNCIAELVNRKMVGHDYTHPSFGGGRMMATKMMASLMAGYE